jgi:hypothetical protein
MAEPTPDADVAALQRLVLTSVLTGRSLPGGAHVSLPEADLIPRHPVLVLDEHLLPAAPDRVSESPVAIRVVGRAHLERLAAEGREPRYVDFGPVHREPGTIVISVNIAVQRRTGPVPLEGVVVTFRQVGGLWVAAPPAAFAT